jgi:hypothetical protein
MQMSFAAHYRYNTIPTALFAEFGFTEAADPAVVLYGFVILLTNIGWIL